MSTLFCNACNTENHSNSTKCEQCKSILSNENINSILQNELENDYLDIDYAEMKGKIIKLENLEEFDKVEMGIEATSIDTLVQAIKEEPEFQIEPDFETQDQKVPADTKKEHVYQCTECNKCFKRNASLMSHITSAHRESSSESERHSSEPLPRGSFSKSKTSPSKPKDESAVESIASTFILKCNFCNEFFANSNLLNAHQSRCEKKEKFHCEVCNIFVSCRGALRKHQQSRQHNYNLNNPHNKEENLKFVCLYCGEKFPIQIALTNHKKIHINEMAAGRPKYYYCKICNKSSAEKCPANHLSMRMEKKPFKCDICGLGYTSNSYLVVHMKLHSGERPFKCSICGATYRHQRNLTKHLFMHTGKRPFECKYCDKTFALRYTFNDHVRLLHTKETPYQCDGCKQSFKASYLLNIHRREEHNIDTNSKRKVLKY